MTEHDRITKQFGSRWADMVLGKGEFARVVQTGILPQSRLDEIKENREKHKRKALS